MTRIHVTLGRWGLNQLPLVLAALTFLTGVVLLISGIAMSLVRGPN